MLLTHTLEIQQKRAERRRALPANSWLVRHLIPEGATASLHLSLPWRRLPSPHTPGMHLAEHRVQGRSKGEGPQRAALRRAAP